MNTQTKIQYAVAIFLVLASFAIALLGFFTPPQGEINESVLWYSAQALLFAASIFGFGSIFKSILRNEKNR